MRETRKLAAIFCSDVVGYSRLVRADEDRTLARLRTLRSDLIDPTIAVHNGRVFKRTGDGAIVEFRSVVDAVRCAMEIQTAMVDRNAGVREDLRIVFRIGVHLGDVVEEADGDLMGDGVNVAARLEGICQPGGICLSEQAYWLAKGHRDIEARDLGPIRLKNIADPVRVFSLQVGLPAQVRFSAAPKPPERRKPLAPALAVVGIAAVLALALPAGGLGWRPWSAPGRPAASIADLNDKLATAPRLSIVVLPFEDSSGDPSQQNFAVPLFGYLTTGIAQLKDSFVVPPGAAFAGKPIDAKAIGRQLGVRYALEGSVRRVGERVAVSAELISTETGVGVWTDRFEGERGQLGQLQEEFVVRLANALGAEPVRTASPPTARELADAQPKTEPDERARRRAPQPLQRQAASPPLAQAAASEPPQTYCGTPLACRRNGGTYHPYFPY